jgi:peptide/nickel transport system permease protein
MTVRTTELVRTKRARQPLTLFGAIGVSLLAINILLALFGSLVAPNSISAFVGGGAFAPSHDGAIFGNDYLGRDLLSRVLNGAKYSLGIPAVATTLGILIGTLIGFAAAEVRGRFDMIVTWIIDVLLSFPPILLALLIIAGLGSSLPVLVGTIAFIQFPRLARVSRSIAMGIAALEFVEVATARGEPLLSVLAREIFPNSIRPLSVEFGLRLSYAVLLISSLSFLGLGIQPPEADWGSMVRENLSGVYYSAPAVIVPALLIGLLVVGINLTADWLSAGSDRNVSEELR